MVGYPVVYLMEERLEVGRGGRPYVEAAGSGELLLKIPVAVPYQNSWDAPEAATGQIEHEGQFYQMKSRQLLNDTLYVRCEFDQNARDRFTELVSRVTDQVTGHTSDTQKGSHATVLKHFLKEYMSQNRKHTFYLLEWAPARTVAFPAPQFISAENLHSVPSPPPDLA
ncbi:hypothetical protein HWI92_04845 [Dyadobacter sandarakinus]|uniref:Uncharacterized protein n=2 Tax=Dyadobacter sandarakinus TaxID=2747268 RepID=A0ABX7ID45_9BACT|nr:hypothetical protein HWI92_04845 [Dyadobacter sandarakinus]